MDYAAPAKAICFTLEHIADLGPDLASGLHGEVASDVAETIIAEAGRFASTRLAPLNASGDREGARFADGAVTLPAGWPDVYREWAAAGWNAVDLSSEYGGMGLPTRLATAAMEMWTSACMSFALGPVLTQGAVDTLAVHASDDLRAFYLPRLVSGEWSATMNLTEPQAGSDLGLLRTRAERNGDGSYRITGTKIFITYGEHDLTDNIVHLVLARLPDAPPGTRGISLFLVPKLLPAPDGTISLRNDLRCAGIEHKMGIHASPTCTMAFGDNGGATGWIVGEEHRGLACMFTMMNKARLFTGLQGVAIAELATQRAIAFARERRQGSAAAVAAEVVPAGPRPIIEHADVRRNLMTMKALTWAGRAIAFVAASAIDRAHCLSDPAARAEAAERAGLLTPIVKAYCSEVGVEVASLGMQGHGGMGYIEDTGMAQLYRDARIAPIYEGTNGIQAIDLVTRKVLRPGSRIARETIAGYRAIGAAAAVSGSRDLAGMGERVVEAADALDGATRWLSEHQSRTDDILGVASPYLRLFAVAAGAAYLAQGAIAAQRRIAAGHSDDVHADAIAVARFYAANVAVTAPALARIVTDSADSLPDRSMFEG